MRSKEDKGRKCNALIFNDNRLYLKTTVDVWQDCSVTLPLESFYRTTGLVFSLESFRQT